MKSLHAMAILLATFVMAPHLFAATYVMGYTPAGGVTVGLGSNAPYTSSPALFTYANFNSSAYQTLYYGVNYVANVAQVGSPTGNMTFQGVLANGSLAWGSTANWVAVGGTCTVDTPTQLIVQVQPLTGTAGFLTSGALNGATTTKGALGITGGGSTDPLFQVVSAQTFQVTFQYFTWDGTAGNLGTGQDLQDTFANCNGGSSGTFQSSVDFEFWWNTAKTTAKSLQVGICKTNVHNYGDIATALAAAPAGAVIQICPGTYKQQFTITQAVTLQGIAFGANQAVILQPPVVFEQNGTTPLSNVPVYAQILVQDAGSVTITGLTIDGNNSGCPAGAVAGVVFLSASSPSSGKLTNSVIRNTASGCSQGAGIYAENGSGFASNISIQGNSIHSINGGAIILGPNVGGTITTNTIDQASSGISFQQAGSVVSVTSNNITSVQDGISLNSATGVVATANKIVNSTDKAINMQDSSGGGSNNVTKNTIQEANCGISVSGAAATDTFLPNTVIDAAATTCQ